jgi:hypothetical protein
MILNNSYFLIIQISFLALSILFGIYPFGSASGFNFMLNAAALVYFVYYDKKYQMVSDMRFVSILKRSASYTFPGLLAFVITVSAWELALGFDVLKRLYVDYASFKLMIEKTEIVSKVGLVGFEQLMSDVKKVTTLQLIWQDIIIRSLANALFCIIASVYFRT